MTLDWECRKKIKENTTGWEKRALAVGQILLSVTNPLQELIKPHNNQLFLQGGDVLKAPAAHSPS